MKVRSEAAQMGVVLGASRQVIDMLASGGLFLIRATEGPAGIFDSTSRSPRERNKGDMPGSAAAVEAS
jgi:hypothetical protein